MPHAPFDQLADEYDAWYDENRGAFRAELFALEHAIPDAFDPGSDRALEVGVGTGRFADGLGIPVGVDPARNSLELARERGIDPVRGVAESLPITTDAIDLAVVVTALAFVDDLEATLEELRRVLTPDGALVVAVLDRESPLGASYEDRKEASPFYADADFLSGEATCAALESAGFTIEVRLQTIFDDPADLETNPVKSAEVREGHGDGLFAVVRARPAE
ncbi:class I SAM-dependent methyltransferase [Natrarchaeobaculum aegyptiacum]|uniref:Methyltransferase type 11 n=1 Tax=Natrarchaeobaculum aegyptiacum TaxID=745377 RepID=A0A2Z2HSA3_9EURY|nr:class I SAM-dependent methyltransferase [Natrarchaeobaculum aegyptiacum]ARS90009.1 methyltransferase type 11 [Natrarchaeobaculum aegyptiacum]